MTNKLSLRDLNIKDHKILMRVDFNVPLNSECQITDDTRIQAALPSIKYVLDHGGALILMSHLGRPKGERKPEMSLKPCADRLSELLGIPVIMAPDCIGEETKKLVNNLKPGEVILLENLRFHIAETKPDTDPSFAKQMADFGYYYVNDAFGTAHRSHSSTATIAQYFRGRAASGFLMDKEIKFLGNALAKPKPPFYAIIGGAKVSSKIGVIESLIPRVDGIIIGGGMAYTFWKALGKNIGNSLCEDDFIDQAKKIMTKCKNLLLPLDTIAASSFNNDATTKLVTEDEGIPDGYMGLDIGPKTIHVFLETLKDAKTVLWNGPLGVCEMPNFARGTTEIARGLADLSATTIVGGGDSIAAINATGLSNKFSHLSTGGGASLEYIEYGHLPGIDALSPAPA